MTMTIEDLSERERVDFFRRICMPEETADRRKEIANRVAIQTDSFDHLIRARINGIYAKADIAAEVARWAIGLFNPQRVAVRRIAVGYKRRPLRRIQGNKAHTKTMNALYKSVRFGKYAPRWHQGAVATNRGIVLARPLVGRRGPTVGYQFVAGSNAEVIAEPGTTEDHPPGVLGVLLEKADPRAQSVARLMTVDSRWFAIWSSQGELLSSEEHGLGRFPGAWNEHNGPSEGDAFNGLDGKGMTKTTIEVGTIAAAMGWTRKTQCRKLIAMLFGGDDGGMGDEDAAPEGQVIGDPEGVLSIDADDVQLVVQDLNVAVTNFLEHIDELDRRAFQQLTGAPAQPNAALMQNPAAAANQLHANSSEAHASIVENLEAFEEDIAEVTVLMARRLGMEAPPVEAVREAFEAQFPPLPFLDTPRERAAIWKERISLGVSDAVEARAEIDGTSEAAAEKRVIELGERQARLNDLRAKRNSPADGTAEPHPGLAGESDAQQTGRFGGRASPPPPPE